MKWFIARTSRKRPTLMHAIDTERYGLSMCGLDVQRWSRVYFERAIPEVQCMRCKASVGHEGIRSV